MRIPQFLIFSALPCLLAAQTSVNLTVYPNPSVFGAPVTLTAAVTPASTTGRVTFFDGVTMLGTRSLFFGAVSISTILLPAGIRKLTALYNGGANVSFTSNVVSQRVNAVAGGGLLVQSPLSILPVLPLAVAVADFNGDGKADFVATGLGDVGSRVVVGLGKGDGGFQTPFTYTIGTPNYVAVGDFDGDGVPDLALSGTELDILLGNGDGTFRQGASYSVLGPASVADFNGDGIADLAMEGNIWIGNGDGTFRPPAPKYAPAETSMVGDFNGDGKADLVLTSTECGGGPTPMESCKDVATLYLGNGDGTLQSPTVVFQSPYASMPSLVARLAVAAGDFNGDGTLDFVFWDGYSFTFLPGKGDGTFGPPKATGATVTGGVSSLTTGDFNGDGIVDLAASTGGAVNLLIGNGDGTFQPPVNQAVGGFGGRLAVADFNGDGKADLIIANDGGGMSVPRAPRLANVSTLFGAEALIVRFAEVHAHISSPAPWSGGWRMSRPDSVAWRGI
jgi:hypothetical protein